MEAVEGLPLSQMLRMLKLTALFSVDSGRYLNGSQSRSNRLGSTPCLRKVQVVEVFLIVFSVILTFS